MLSSGNDHDSTHAIQLLERSDISGGSVLATRPYGAVPIRTYIEEHGASYEIPPKSNVSGPWPVDWHLYKERHLVVCFFQKIKWLRCTEDAARSKESGEHPTQHSAALFRCVPGTRENAEVDV